MRGRRTPTDSCFCHASSIQTLPVNNFPSSLEWSNDGQAFTITRANIHLWTPLLGYSVPLEALHQQNHLQNHSSSTDHALQDPPATPSSASGNTPQPQISASTETSARPHQIPMSTTIIEVKKQFGCNWSAHSNELHIITPPNDDRFWRMASWSPSGLSILGSCLLAALTTTCDVFVFSPGHNFQSGLWEMEKPNKNLSEELLKFFFESYTTVVQITQYSLGRKDKKVTKDQNEMYLDRSGTGSKNDDDEIGAKKFEEEIDISPETDWSESKQAQLKRSRLTSCVLRTQTTALAWSPAYSHSIINSSQTQINRALYEDNPNDSSHPAFNLGNYDCDFSLLALGHRRGDISLWRHTSNGDMEIVCFKPICPDGLTFNLLSWSDWSLCQKERHGTKTLTVIEEIARDEKDPNQYELKAYLAIANSKGVVYILQVSQPFQRRRKSSNSNGTNTASTSTSIKMNNSNIDIQISSVYQNQLNLSSITCFKWIPSFMNNIPPTLVLSRLGEIVFVQVSSRSEERNGSVNTSASTNYQIIQLPALHPYDDRLSWPDCHSWSSCSGISAIPIKKCYEAKEITNRIVVMLSNGLIFVLNQTSSNKESSQSIIQLDLQNSIQLSLDFRSKFRNITMHQSIQPQNHNNLGQISKQNVMTVYGSSVLSTVLHAHDQPDQFEHQLYLGSSGSIMSWLYEIDSPNKFCYKPENRQILHFCMADFNPVEISFTMQTEQQDLSTAVDRRRSQLIGLLQAQIKILPTLFIKPTSCIQVSPNLKLMNIFNILHLIFSDLGLFRIPILLESLSSNLFELLDVLDNHNDNVDSNLEGINYDQQETDGFENHYLADSFIFVKANLVRNIFYNHHLDNLRLKVNLTSFLLNRIDKIQLKNLRSRLVDIKVKISRLIHKEILNIVAKCFLNYQVKLKDEEKTIISKYNFASQVIKTMPEPTLEQLLEPEEMDHKLLDQDRLLSFLLPSSRASSPSSLEEHGKDYFDDQIISTCFKDESCPACLEPVQFDSLRFATCKTGHIWDRCSVTFEILSMIELKICTNCGRKSIKSNKGGRDLMNEAEIQEGEARGKILNRDQDYMQDKTNNDNHLNYHPIFLDFFLDSFVCCPHCGGRWKISS